MTTKRPAVLYAAVLSLLVFAAFFLFQAGGCSRPSPPEEEPWEEPAAPRHPVLEPEGAETVMTVTRPAGVDMEGAEGRAVRAYDGATPSSVISARREGQGGVAVSRHWGASSTTSRAPPLRSKLARRVLAWAPPLEGAEMRSFRDDNGAAAPARGEDQGAVVTRSMLWTASLSRPPPPPPRSAANLARRVMAGAPPGGGSGAADSAARSSCKTSDKQVGCPPHH